MGPPLCAICGVRIASHVCQKCGKSVCVSCIDPTRWTCIQCLARDESVVVAPPAGSHSFFYLPTLMFFVAFLMIFVGIALTILGSFSNISNASGGAIILIGPIPIILGSGPYSAALIAIAAILTIVSLAFFVVIRKRA